MYQSRGIDASSSSGKLLAILLLNFVVLCWLAKGLTFSGFNGKSLLKQRGFLGLPKVTTKEHSRILLLKRHQVLPLSFSCGYLNKNKAGLNDDGF